MIPTEREDWTAETYFEKINTLYELRGTIPDSQWDLLFLSLKKELSSRFPEETNILQNKFLTNSIF